MSAQATAYLIGTLVCSWLIIIIALVALLMAWRKVKEQKREIKALKKERAAQSNSLREKGCDIDRLEKTLKNIKKQRRKP
jgi:septal ring factor EnvC (AmiA/AmiB activator)